MKSRAVVSLMAALMTLSMGTPPVLASARIDWDTLRSVPTRGSGAPELDMQEQFLGLSADHNLSPIQIRALLLHRITSQLEGEPLEIALAAFATLEPGRVDAVTAGGWRELLEAFYEAGVNDQDMPPMVLVDADGQPVGRIQDGDVVIMFDFRTDRAKPLSASFVGVPFEGQVGGLSDLAVNEQKPVPQIYLVTMTNYDDGFQGDDVAPARRPHVAYAPPALSDTYAEVVGRLGVTQLVIGESEKWRAISWFKDGRRNLGYEEQAALTPEALRFDSPILSDEVATVQAEDVRVMAHPELPIEQQIVRSRQVASHDLAPQMRAKEIADLILLGIQKGTMDVYNNFANADMVAHAATDPEKFERVVDAILALDEQLGRIIPLAIAAGYTVLISADHGNAEHMLSADSSADPSHTPNKVPFIVLGLEAGEEVTIRQEGTIADMSPTVMMLRGVDAPDSWSRGSMLEGTVNARLDRKIVRIVLDGYGLSDEEYGNAMVAAAARKGSLLHVDRWMNGEDGALAAAVEASGEEAGYPPGVAGTTEFGHVLLDGGRDVESDLVIIDRAIADGSFAGNQVFAEAMEVARESQLHLIGIISDGRVHSSPEHLDGVLQLAANAGLDPDQVNVHFVSDGRDVPGNSAPGYLEWLEGRMAHHGVGRVVDIGGRAWGKDRDNRWFGRIEPHYRMLVEGTAAVHVRLTEPADRAGATLGGAGSVRGFLQSAKAAFESLDASQESKPVLHISRGNPAADADSVATAIADAFLKAYLATDASTLFLPLVNIPKEDLHLRTEVVYLLNEFGITEDDVLFTDTLDVRALRDQGFEVRMSMWDHNHQEANEQDLWPLVVEIVDHHADQGQYRAHANVTVVEIAYDDEADDTLVGSATTLVAERILETDLLQQVPELAKLLLGPILLDTINLDPEKGRVRARDQAAADRLLRVATDVSQDGFFSQLEAAKLDKGSFDIVDFLRYDPKPNAPGARSWGISSIFGVPMHDLPFKGGDLIESLEAVRDRYGWDVMFVMTADPEEELDLDQAQAFGHVMFFDWEGGPFYRELLIYSADPNRLDKLTQFLQADGGRPRPVQLRDRSIEVRVQPDLFGPRVRTFGMNTDMSRRYLEPLLEQFFDAEAALAQETDRAGATLAGERSYGTLDDMRLKGRTVLVRPDFNGTVREGRVGLTDRIRESAKTIQELAEAGARVVVIAHQGRAGVNDPNYMESMEQHAELLSNEIGRLVQYVDDLFGGPALAAISGLGDGDVIHLKNVRPLEEDPVFVQNLEPLFDLFVLDAFSVAHRGRRDAQPSIDGFENLPTVAGRLMEREMEGNLRVLTQLEHPYVEFLGGSKISDHIDALAYGLENGLIDGVATGGMLGQLMLLLEGYDLGERTMAVLRTQDVNADRPNGLLDLLPQLREIYDAHTDKFEVPSDLAYLDGDGDRQEVLVTELTAGQFDDVLFADNGTQTAERYAALTEGLKTGFIKGPQGDNREPNLSKSSEIVFRALAGSGAFWMTGGGDTDSVLRDLGLTPSYQSLAGGAFLEFKAGKPLPGVVMLNERSPQAQAEAAHGRLAGSFGPEALDSQVAVFAALLDAEGRYLTTDEIAARLLIPVNVVARYLGRLRPLGLLDIRSFGDEAAFQLTEASRERGAELVESMLPSGRQETGVAEEVIILTEAEAFTQAQIGVLQPVLSAVRAARDEQGMTGDDGKLHVLTTMYIQGDRLDAGVDPDWLTEEIRAGVGGDLGGQIASLQTFRVNVMNPLGLSMSTVRTVNHRPIDARAVRQLLAQRGDVAVIQVNSSGSIDTQTFTDELLGLLNGALMRHGLLAESEDQPDEAPVDVSSIVQVTESDIPGELKIAALVPAPDKKVTRQIHRLMRLAHRQGIDVKALLETAWPVTAEAQTPEPGVALLGEKPLVPAPVERTRIADDRATALAGASLDGVPVNVATQTIELSGGSMNGITPGFDFGAQFSVLARRVEETGKLVRIVVPTGSPREESLRQYVRQFQEMFQELTFTSHAVSRSEDGFGQTHTAFMIQPRARTVIVGYGNEAVKVAQAFQSSGFGTPSVVINSLNRFERVIHAFQMGYGIYLSDTVTASGPDALEAFESRLEQAVIEAEIAGARNDLLRQLPPATRVVTDELLREAEARGRGKGGRMFQEQYHGLFSTALLNDEQQFDLVVDATPEGQGAANKQELYERSADLHEGMAFIFQGGEAGDIVDASFNAVTASFSWIAEAASYLRQVSCNTVGLSTFIHAAAMALGVPIVVDNQAIRRSVDPGDDRPSADSIGFRPSSHHGQDVLTVLPETFSPLLAGLNTDAMQTGVMTRFHLHVAAIRRADGLPLSKQAVQRALAAHSRVALIDFPDGRFSPARLSEIPHNLLPQRAMLTPEGSNHALVPMVTVWETDDPAQLMVLYAIPQEAIVAPGNVSAAHALLGMASQQASLAIVDEAMGIPELVKAIEGYLPVQGLTPEGLEVVPGAPMVIPTPVVILPGPLASADGSDRAGATLAGATTAAAELSGVTTVVFDLLGTLQRATDLVMPPRNVRLIRDLTARGFNVAVLTDASQDEIDETRQAYPVLRHVRWIAQDELGASKREASAYEGTATILQEEFGVTAGSQVLYVEDDPTMREAGGQLGWRTLAADLEADVTFADSPEMSYLAAMGPAEAPEASGSLSRTYQLLTTGRPFRSIGELVGNRGPVALADLQTLKSLRLVMVEHGPDGRELIRLTHAAHAGLRGVMPLLTELDAERTIDRREALRPRIQAAVAQHQGFRSLADLGNSIDRIASSVSGDDGLLLAVRIGQEESALMTLSLIADAAETHHVAGIRETAQWALARLVPLLEVAGQDLPRYQRIIEGVDPNVAPNAFRGYLAHGDRAIAGLEAREVLDSRGRPTVLARLTLADGTRHTAQVPSGASTGDNEAHELRDGDASRYRGLGVRQAVAHVLGGIQERVLGMDGGDSGAVAQAVIALDGTPNKSNLGANATLAVSRATIRASAAVANVELYEYLSKQEAGQGKFRMPIPSFNILNGGRHAGNNAYRQEFMALPHNFDSFEEANLAGLRVFESLWWLLVERDYYEPMEPGGITPDQGTIEETIAAIHANLDRTVPDGILGDEKGFAPNLPNDEEGVILVEEAIRRTQVLGRRLRPGLDVALTLDVAAAELYEKDPKASFRDPDDVRQVSPERYLMGDDVELSTEELVESSVDWVNRYPSIVSIEDGVDEHDMSGRKMMTVALGHRIWIVGDDWYASQVALLQEGIDNQDGNAVLLKDNQAGTVEELTQTHEFAKRDGRGSWVSHRSGENADAWIADEAVAFGVIEQAEEADAEVEEPAPIILKTGAPYAPGGDTREVAELGEAKPENERGTKFARVREIERALGPDRAVFPKLTLPPAAIRAYRNLMVERYPALQQGLADGTVERLTGTQAEGQVVVVVDDELLRAQDLPQALETLERAVAELGISSLKDSRLKLVYLNSEAATDEEAAAMLELRREAIRFANRGAAELPDVFVAAVAGRDAFEVAERIRTHEEVELGPINLFIGPQALVNEFLQLKREEAGVTSEDNRSVAADMAAVAFSRDQSAAAALYAGLEVLAAEGQLDAVAAEDLRERFEATLDTATLMISFEPMSFEESVADEVRSYQAVIDEA